MRQDISKFLSELDILNANPVRFEFYKDIRSNTFLRYGQCHHAMLMAVENVSKSTNPLHISDGLLSEFYIIADELDNEWDRDGSMCKDAYGALKKQALLSINIVHIHIRTRVSLGNDRRRGSLSLLLNESQMSKPEERMFVYETIDIDAISKQIIECMSAS